MVDIIPNSHDTFNVARWKYVGGEVICIVGRLIDAHVIFYVNCKWTVLSNVDKLLDIQTVMQMNGWIDGQASMLHGRHEVGMNR